MKTILLTGATGFLGSHLLEALLKNNYRVIILKRSTSDTWRIEHLLNSVKSYDVDNVNLSNVFRENIVDYIIHLATLYRKIDIQTEVRKMLDSNVSFPSELLELAVHYKVKGFINTGTYFEYDCSQLPISENSELRPFNFYAKTKLAFEYILKTYESEININTLRLFSPYGEKDNPKLIPLIISKAISGETIELSDGLQKLDFIYVGDIVKAYLKSVDNMANGTPAGYNVYNIGTGVGISVREIVSIVEQKLETTIHKVWGKPSTVDYPVVFSDTRKVQAELGWQPTISIHDGLEKIIKYYMRKNENKINLS